MKLRFIFFVAARYFRTKRKDRKIASSVFSVTGIAVGVMTLVVVLSVMNGFQLSFIEPILEVKSYHIQISPKDPAGLSPGVLDAIRNMEGVRTVVPFIEIQAIADNSRPCIVRAIPADSLKTDPGFDVSFDSSFDKPDESHLKGEGTIVLGNQLAEQLYLVKGGDLSLFTFAGPAFERLSPRNQLLNVTGLFKTGFYEIDLNWGFISLETAQFFESSLPKVYGIKLKDRMNDGPILKRLRRLLEGEDVRIESWREFNRVFFGALLTEKLLMMFLIGLIFIVVGFNIFHSLRRSVYERQEEIATLKAIGATIGTVKNIFISEGIMIGFLGSLLGMILGLLIAENINQLFRLTEEIANSFFIPVLQFILKPIDGSVRIEPVSIFSPRVFYINEVPIRLFVHELFIISIAALSSSALAASFAAGSIARIKPSIILRNE